jgi:hypothetical protein
VCEWDVSGESVDGDTVTVDVSNTGELSLNVTWVGISWTGDDNMRSIRWDGSTLWSGFDPSSPRNVSTSQTVPPGESRTVEYEFWGSSFDGEASANVAGDC